MCLTTHEPFLAQDAAALDLMRCCACDVVCSYAVKEINNPKRAHNYSVNSPLAILFAWTGTFWPLVVRRYELYVYPLVHIGLVAYMGARFNQEGSGSFWEDPRNMVPWASLSLLSPLMIFFLVFFLSQCYNRFNSFFATSMAIEGSLQNLTMLMLAHVTDPAKQKLKWDAVRYLTAAAMVIYSRVSKIAMGKEAQMDIENWGRLLKRERFWQAEGGEVTLTLTPSPSPSPSTSPSPSHHHLTPSPPNKLTLAPSRPHGLMASTPSTLTFTITT